jgi:uncharacterized protein
MAEANSRDQKLFTTDQALSWIGDFTPQFKHYVRKLQERLPKEEFEKSMKEFLSVYSSVILALSKLPKGAERAQMAQDLIESEVSEGKPSDVSCSRGCAACCKTYPKQILEDEADQLAELIRAGEIKVDIEEIERQAQSLARAKAGQGTFQDHCVFLGKDNACSIYKHRPTVCRKYFVTSPAEACGSPGAPVALWISPMAEVIVSAAMGLSDNRRGFMIELLAERLCAKPLVEDESSELDLT